MNMKLTSSPGIGISLLDWLVEGCWCFGVVLVSDASDDGVTDLLLSSVISNA